MVPKRVGRYQVLHPLATGGMAEILLACLKGPRRFERVVVLKRILPHLAREPLFVQMFVDEARSLARISHPNVVQVSDFGHDEGELFLAMEYVAGENLAALMRRVEEDEGEPLAPELAAHIVAEACAGLHAAHELHAPDGTPLGIVHRDISPQNILLAYDGHVKVVDFGIALSADRSTRSDTGSLKGKLEYMSPEQTHGQKVDRRSDVFSIGIVLHELLTGRRLYARGGHAQVVEAICSEPLVPPSRTNENCPQRLDEICARALEKSPDDRYPTAAALRKDLLEVARSIADPTDVLATKMRGLFAKRIADKTSLVARVVAADATSDVTEILGPPREQVGPRVPVASALAPTMPAEIELVPEPPRRRTVLPVVAAVVVAVVIAAGAIGFARARRPREAPGTPMPSAIAVPAADTPDAAAPATVLITVKTVPPGAHVSVDGTLRGDTPLDVPLARGATPAEIRVERPGFVPIVQTVTTDRDQTMVLSLVPAPRARGGRPSRPAPRPSASGFWRFD